MLGIDVSKDTLDVALVDAGSRQVVLQRQVSNSTAGVNALLAAVPPGVPWVVEPTGRYSLLVAQKARMAGRRVLLAPPRQTKRYIQSLNPRATTDKIAAWGLAFFGLDRPLLDYPLKADHVDEVDQLLSARRGLSRTISSLYQQSQDLPRARESLSASLAVLRPQLEQLDKRIETAVKSSRLAPLVQRLRRVPGIGPVSSAAFGSRLDSRDFAHADQWIAYCGLDVSVRQSGKRRGQLGLTKQGDAELRRLAFLCAQAAVRKQGSPFTAQYQRELAKGMSKIAAHCAVARKLLTVLWAIQHHGVEYDAQMVYLPPWERRRRQ